MEDNVPPPPDNAPPVITPRPPVTPPPLPRAEPPRRRRWPWVVLAVALIVLYVGVRGVMWVAHMGGGMASARGHAGHSLVETVIEENHARNKIAVVDVDGIISGAVLDYGGLNMVSSIKSQLDLAAEDDLVKAVVLRVDSPGGEVLASDEIYRAIKEFQEDSGKPVIASMGSLAASGGYYVSAPCRWIVANEMTITASIGVIMHTYNYRGLMDKVGVRPEVFKSGKFKDMLSGEKPETSPEERQMVQNLVDETFARFKTVVAEGRHWSNGKNKSEGKVLSPNWEDYADGRIISGKQAASLGFVDEIGNFDAAVKRAETLAASGKANLIQYQQPFDIGSLFHLFGKAETRAIKVDLGLDLPRLQIGRLYFLCPTVLH